MTQSAEYRKERTPKQRSIHLSLDHHFNSTSAFATRRQLIRSEERDFGSWRSKARLFYQCQPASRHSQDSHRQQEQRLCPLQPQDLPDQPRQHPVREVFLARQPKALQDSLSRNQQVLSYATTLHALCHSLGVRSLIHNVYLYQSSPSWRKALNNINFFLFLSVAFNRSVCGFTSSSLTQN